MTSEPLPPSAAKPDFGDICERCHERYGLHLGRSCRDRAGEFAPLRPVVQPSAAPALDVEKLTIVARVRRFVERMRLVGGIPEYCGLAWDLCNENERLKSELLEWENIEAACCPEDVGFEEYIAHLLAENRELHTLAKIGTWHNDCRMNRKQAAQELEKSQAIINKLADTISQLEARLRALQTPGICNYRVERGEEGDWHIFTKSDGQRLQIFTNRPLVIVDSEIH